MSVERDAGGRTKMPGAADAARQGERNHHTACGVRQLALEVGLNAARRFNNFVPAGNEAAISALQALLRGKTSGHIYLSGGTGTGKTHLLQACCAFAAGANGRVAYLPLAERAQLDESLLRDLDQTCLVCVDDVDRIARDGRWERAVFSLYNDLNLAGVPMVFAGRDGPGGIELADLRSRLSAALRFNLSAPSDAHRAAVLGQRASDLGIELSAEVLGYVLSRHSRDLGELMALLSALDRYALAAKRRVTVALVREYLAQSRHDPSSNSAARSRKAT